MIEKEAFVLERIVWHDDSSSSFGDGYSDSRTLMGVFENRGDAIAYAESDSARFPYRFQWISENMVNYYGYFEDNSTGKAHGVRYTLRRIPYFPGKDE